MARFTARVFARRALGVAVGLSIVGGVVGGRDAEAFSVKQTTRGDFVHWEETEVAYTIDSSVDANVADGVTATREAMSSWSGTVGAPDLSVATATADAPAKPGYDQKNGIFYMKGGYAPAGRALAITVLTYDNASGRILDADVIFNGSYRFAVLGAAPVRDATTAPATSRPSSIDGVSHGEVTQTDSVYDLHHVIAHELGHSLGMNDEMERSDALMYRYSAPNDPSMREPTSDDIQGLAELYSTKLEAHGNGCGGATVAPKKPSRAAGQLAIVASLGLLAFLLLRARNDRRARVGFVVATAAVAVAMLPSVSPKSRGVARAAELAPGQARAKVLAAETSISDGLFQTTYRLATMACRASACPTLGHGASWGGTVGTIRQEVGGFYAPSTGDEVDVTFAKLPNTIAPLSSPLAGHDSGAAADEEITVLTRAN